MNADLELLALRHIQALAIHFISYGGQLPALVGFLRHSMGDSAPSVDELDLFIRKANTQRELALNWETALFKSASGQYHLVCITPELDVEVARRRLNEYPTSPTQCRWCLQDSKSFVDLDLISELDIHGHPVNRSRLHKLCMRPWLRMRDLVEHADAKKESLK